DYNLSGSSGGATFDGDIHTLDRVETTSFNLGGVDTINGNEDNDVAIGGSAGDNINGNAGNDILVGDQAEVDYSNSNDTRIITRDRVDADGGIDTIHGNDGADIAMGGVQGDLIFGDADNDILLGDEGQVQFNLTGGLNQDGDPLTIDNIETLQPSLGGI